MKPFRLLWLLCLGLLAACQPARTERYFGYVEGDYTRVSAEVPGRLTQLAVARGQSVQAGAPLFALDTDLSEAQSAQASAELARARAQLADTEKGRRPEELAQLKSDLAAAQGDLQLARAQYDRQSRLVAQNFVSASARDDAAAVVTRAKARVDSVQQQLDLARKGSRADQIAAQRAGLDSAQAGLAQNQSRLDRAHVAAPVGARVADTFYTVGEQVAAGAPVLSLLAPGNVRFRFYVPATVASTLKPGSTVVANCAGCPAGIAAKVESVATQPEYTPPVIYSREQRSTLVFLVQAKPDPAQAQTLNPGTPIDVSLSPKDSQ
jgi:HlyD family secretion protein